MEIIEFIFRSATQRLILARMSRADLLPDDYHAFKIT